MGCTSSNHIKKQAYGEAWMSPPSKPSPGPRTFNSDIEDYHRQLLAATSSSDIGLATLDSPKTAGTDHRAKENAAGNMDSVNDMFNKLGTLESSESGPKSWDEVSSMLETLKSIPPKNNSSRPADFGLPEKPESIDVGDIMKGLDDETPRGSSASQAVDSPATPPGPSLPTRASASRQPIKKFDEAMSIHTVDELDARLGISKDSDVCKISKDSLEDAAIKSHTHEVGRLGTAETDGSEKENAKPPGSENGHVRGRGVVPSKTALRSPFVPPQVNSKRSFPPPHVSPVEDISLSKDVSINSSTGIASTPAMKYAASSGIVKLTFSLGNQKNISTGAPTRQTTSTPEVSLSKIALENPGYLMTEPGSSYFDPELLSSYEKALRNHSEDDWNVIQVNDTELHQKANREHGTSIEEKRAVQELSPSTNKRESSEVPNLSTKTMIPKIGGKLYDPFETFEEKCPPGGEKTVVLYTTTLRGIRKTFEDCNTVRGILQSFGLSIDLRDVSMHLEFRNELRELMERVVSVPRLFIQGRYIGGQEEVTKLHEDGKLTELIEGLPKEMTEGNCDGCGGMRFIPCLECSGSCKIVEKGKNVRSVRCPHCNENGLIQCPICS